MGDMGSGVAGAGGRFAGGVCALWLGAAFSGPALAGETRCWIDKGALVASAAFGDIAGDFLVDLGAPASQLHLTRAQSDGIETDGVRNPVVTRDLIFAGERVRDFPMAVADLDASTRAFDTTINGVLGADLLSRFTVEIAFSPCRLRLTHRSAKPLAHGIRLAVREVGGRPLVAATLSDGPHVRPGLFAIRTADWASRIGGARLSRPLPAAAATGEPAVRLRAVEIGGRLFEQVPAAVEARGADQADGAIGMAVWSRWRLRLDVQGGWLDLVPAE
jgi:hypothetical protein